MKIIADEDIEAWIAEAPVSEVAEIIRQAYRVNSRYVGLSEDYRHLFERTKARQEALETMLVKLGIDPLVFKGGAL